MPHPSARLLCGKAWAMMYPNDNFSSGLSRNLLFIISTTLLLGGAGVLGYQAYLWVTLGYWPQMSFGEFWLTRGGPYPNSTWSVYNQAMLWLFRQPLSAVALALGLLLASGRARGTQGEVNLGPRAVPVKRR